MSNTIQNQPDNNVTTDINNDNETEMIFDEKGQIKFATLYALVVYLTTESNDKKDKNKNFDKIFMQTFRLYCDPSELLQLLIKRVKSNHDELMTKLKVHDIIKIWLLS